MNHFVQNKLEPTKALQDEKNWPSEYNIQGLKITTTITTTTTKMNAFISFIPSRKFIQNVRYIKNTIVLTEISSKGAEKGFLVKIKKNSCCKL